MSDGKTVASKVVVESDASYTTSKELALGSSFRYEVPGISGQRIKWSVGNTAVATVDVNGNVTSKNIGNTYLYAGLPNGATIKCLVKVVYPTLKIRYTEKTLHINQTFSFSISGDAGRKSPGL